MKQPLLLTLLALTLVGCNDKTPSKAAEEQTKAVLTAVRTVTAAPRTFERRVTVQGNLQSKYVAAVAARLAGTLDAIFVDAGDRVEANQTELFQIDPVALENAVIASEQECAVAKASLDVARAALGKAEAEATKVARDLERYERLHKGAHVTDNEFELRQVQHEQAKAGLAVSKAEVVLAESLVAQAMAALGISRKNLQDSKGIAPISGFVSVRTKEPGEHVTQGSIILRIEDPSYIEAVAYLPAANYADVIPGKTKAHLMIEGKEAGTFVVTYRSPVIDPLMRIFEIKGKVDQQGTVAGAMVEITLVFETRQAIGVPSSSILFRKDRHVVFVVEEGQANLKQVEPGLVNDGWTEICSGLTESDKVVSEGQTQIREGDAVTVL